MQGAPIMLLFISCALNLADYTTAGKWQTTGYLRGLKKAITHFPNTWAYKATHGHEKAMAIFQILIDTTKGLRPLVLCIEFGYTGMVLVRPCLAFGAQIFDEPLIKRLEGGS